MSGVLLPVSVIRESRMVAIESARPIRPVTLEEGDLIYEATIKEYLIVRREGQRQVLRPIRYSNLAAADMTMATVKEYLTVCRGRGRE
jgi:hypothetical protein